MRLVFLLALTGCGFGSEEAIGVEDGMVGCGESESSLGADWAASLEAEGCQWYLRAVDDRETVLLSFDIPEFAAAYEGESLDAAYVLPDDAVRFTVEVGCGMDQGVCQDAEFTPFVADTYTPTSGSVRVTGTPSGEFADVTVTFTDVILQSTLGEVAELPALTLSVQLEG
jgi:hypothetical protein